VRDLPADLVVKLIQMLAEGLADLIANARNGEQSFGGNDFGHTLILLNLWHAEVADWEVALDLLADRAVSSSAKRRSLRLLAEMPDRIPADICDRLRPIATALVRRDGKQVPDPFDPRSIAGEAALLGAAIGAFAEDEAAWRLVELIGGDRADRLLAATLAARSPTPEHIGILVALTGDAVPDVRARAAAGLAERLASGEGGILVLQTLRACLDDPGTRVGEAIAATLRYATAPAALQFRDRLNCHPSARVRSLAASATT
jgi:hypothetical protein